MVSNELPPKSNVPVLAESGMNRYQIERAGVQTLGSFASTVALTVEVVSELDELGNVAAQPNASFDGFPVHAPPFAYHSIVIDPVEVELKPPICM
jgi:hypothetical protein